MIWRIVRTSQKILATPLDSLTETWLIIGGECNKRKILASNNYKLFKSLLEANKD